MNGRLISIAYVMCVDVFFLYRLTGNFHAYLQINASKQAGIDTKRICAFVAEYVAKVKTAQKRVVADKMHVMQS
jgi:hypothetical protein